MQTSRAKLQRTRHADYFTPEFLSETGNLYIAEGESGAYYLVVDSAGRFINVVNGLRVTTDQPSHPVRRVLAFGGSTMLSEEVPDRYTIPSFLQRSINDRCGTPAAVLN